MLLLLSNNINIQSPWMLSLEIFGSLCAVAVDYRQIRYRPSILAGASKDFINEYNDTSQFFTSSRKILCSEKVFIYIIFYIYLKWMGLNLSTNLPMFVYSFQAMWRHRSVKEYSFLLEFALHVLSLVHILWAFYLHLTLHVRKLSNMPSTKQQRDLVQWCS